jgi:hypothetical protein|tara:strand:+ start:12320 stop:13774 length:1455 start_codon:yes stop_codon:yes gene_type:complete
MSKLGIVVPYRDREEHLSRFIPSIEDRLQSQNIVDYEIIIVEQANDLPFNRGWLCNIGFDISKQLKCDYVVFHDVDMLPEDESCDYSWVDRPTHLATKLSNNKYKLPYPEYFGGVTMFPVQHFEVINGFSNEYWGWGFEDDDLLYRCRQSGVPMNEELVSSKQFSNPFINLMYFSPGDYIEVDSSPIMNKTFERSYTMEMWVEPSDKLEIDRQKDYDEFHLMCKPGYHSGICWTSAQQYKGGVWNTNSEQAMVVSHKMSEQWSHVVFSVDSVSKTLSLYVNGNEVDNSPSNYFGNLSINKKSDSLFIGCASPKLPKDNNWFSGRIAQVSMWKRFTDRRAVRQLFNDGVPHDVTKPKNEYSFVDDLILSYDFENIQENKVKDSSKYNHNGEIYGAIRRKSELQIGEKKSLPTRRDGKFICLDHESNGWQSTKYKDWRSRENQIRFFNLVRTDLEDYSKDGLSSLDYKVVNKEDNNNIKVVSVTNE